MQENQASSSSWVETNVPSPRSEENNALTSHMQEICMSATIMLDSDESASADESEMLAPTLMETAAITASMLPVSSQSQVQDLDTTVSTITGKKVRTRISSKWISTFQIMDVPRNFIHQKNSSGSFSVTDEKSVAKIDDWLKKFFKAYNENAKQLRNNRIEVLHALGGRYMFHSQHNLIMGIVILETQMCKTPQFNCHLLVEKSRPDTVPSFEIYHKTIIGHAYPIHTTDLSCIGGNSLRPLLRNWIDDTFFKSLHWVIPPSTLSMRKLNEKEAEIRDEEAMTDFIELLTEMKKLLLKNYRVNLSEMENNTAPSQSQNTSTSIYEFLNISKGKEYPVESHNWHIMQIPLNENGKINETAYRAVTSIKRKGGIVKTVSRMS